MLNDAIGLEQELGLLRAAYLVRLERDRPQSYRHLFHRHYVHHLGPRGNLTEASIILIS